MKEMRKMGVDAVLNPDAKEAEVVNGDVSLVHKMCPFSTTYFCTIHVITPKLIRFTYASSRTR